eukprot:GHRQ01012720.1.p1 GENE.GHRQ01012720.1~~GHRQ01012720.1.p1  ORF type:complete len:219 (+),score=34.44 GHRQ01012720.1:363-1019(+)
MLPCLARTRLCFNVENPLTAIELRFILSAAPATPVLQIRKCVALFALGYTSISRTFFEMSVEVGERLVVAKHRATVRYVGPVEGQEGTWAGLEWDDPSRGKHDGTTGGKRYFSCSSDSPTAASFVRISKISRSNSLVDALVLRYTNQLAEGQAAAVDAQVFLHTSNHRKVWVELVGEQKVTERLSKTELLQAARLVGANISHVVSVKRTSFITSHAVL